MFCWIINVWDIRLIYIQSKDYVKGTYETKKVYLSCFYDKIHILNNGYDRLALG